MLFVTKWILAVDHEYDDNHPDDKGDQNKSRADPQNEKDGTKKFCYDDQQQGELASHAEKIIKILAIIKSLKLAPSVRDHQQTGARAEYKKAEVNCPAMRSDQEEA